MNLIEAHLLHWSKAALMSPDEPLRHAQAQVGECPNRDSTQRLERLRLGSFRIRLTGSCRTARYNSNDVAAYDLRCSDDAYRFVNREKRIEVDNGKALGNIDPAGKSQGTTFSYEI